MRFFFAQRTARKRDGRDREIDVAKIEAAFRRRNLLRELERRADQDLYERLLG